MLILLMSPKLNLQCKLEIVTVKVVHMSVTWEEEGEHMSGSVRVYSPDKAVLHVCVCVGG